MITIVELRRAFDEWVQTFDFNQFFVNEYGVTRFVADENMPAIQIDGVDFTFLTTYMTGTTKGDREFIINYQANEGILYISGEVLYTLLDIGVLEHITKGGKIKRKLITAGTWKTRLY